MLCKISRQDIFLAIGYSFEIRCIVIIVCQRDIASEFIHAMDLSEAVLTSIFRPGILTQEPHNEIFLTSHRIICDVIKPVSYIHAVSPARLVYYLDYPLVHIVLFFFFPHYLRFIYVYFIRFHISLDIVGKYNLVY